MRVFASLLLAIALLLHLMAIPFTVHGYKLTIDPIEYSEIEGLDLAPRKWTKRDKFEAAGFVGNQVQDPNTPDLTKIWQKSKLIHAKLST